MKQTLLPLAGLLMGALTSSACMHTDVKLPGVLDLRSDGSGATAVTEPIKTTEETRREGFGAIINGEGVISSGDKVTIEDRNWHLFGLVHIINDHGEAEFKALPSNTALCKVRVGDSITGSDVVSTIVPGLCPCTAWANAAPHITTSFSGTRIQAGAGAVEPPPPTDGIPPLGADPTAVDPNAPTPVPGT